MPIASAHWRAALVACALALCSAAAHATENFGVASSDGDLAAVRGREGLQLPPMQVSNTSMNATLTGNSVAGAMTGSNLTADSVFSGASGIATLIQNSGNQVIIQNNVIINLTVK